MIPEKRSDFEKWYREHLKKYGKTRGPIGMREWFAQVEQSHERLRDVIGDIRVIKPVMLKANEVPQDNLMMDNYINSIMQFLPNYLKEYGFTREMLRNPTLPDGIRTTKHIRGYADRIKVDGNVKYYVDFYSERLANLHATVVPHEDINAFFTLATSAASFAKLGHFGVDEGSCFGEGGSRRSHKYYLGQTPNTFVGLLSTKEKPEIEGEDDNIARCWGFVSRDGIYNICNIYNINPTTRTEKLARNKVIELFKKGVQEVFERDDLASQANMVTTNHVVYLNGGSITLFPKNEGIVPQVLKAETHPKRLTARR